MSHKFSLRQTIMATALLGLTLLPLTSVLPIRQASAANDSPHTPVSSDGSYRTVFGQPDDVIQTQNGAYVKGHPGTNKRIHEFAPSSSRTSNQSAGHLGEESVIGQDERTEVQDPSVYPYSAIVKIESDIGGCTGWLISPDTVVTAGHCVYDPNKHKWASFANVYPGRNGNDLPYGSAKARTFYSVTGWTEDGDGSYDYGAIKLNWDIGDSAGWFGYRWKSGSLDGTPENLSGYPGDKEYGTQWEDRDQIRKSTAYKLYYSNDTYGGQSGSPVYQENSRGCGVCSIAIHTNGVYGYNGYNSGTRITQEVFNNLNLWRQQ
ncbi:MULTISPECIES: serine protease [Thermoactinomyces]|jgi:glutamyl endopeptidase|nr:MULTISPECIES: serine protease [Thermoactinomyces]